VFHPVYNIHVYTHLFLHVNTSVLQPTDPYTDTYFTNTSPCHFTLLSVHLLYLIPFTTSYISLAEYERTAQLAK